MSSGRTEESSSSEIREAAGNQQGRSSDQSGLTAAPLMLSQYQKDFSPPPCPRRCTPALPYPDNIGINPAFRWDWVCCSKFWRKKHVKDIFMCLLHRLEFCTVQKEAYPAWQGWTVEVSIHVNFMYSFLFFLCKWHIFGQIKYKIM